MQPYMTMTTPPWVDSSYHYISFVHKAIRKFEVNVDVQKGALSFTKIMKTNVLGSSNLGFYPLLSYGNGPQWLSCPLLLGFAFEF